MDKKSFIKHLDFLIIDMVCLSISFWISFLIKFDSSIKELENLYSAIFIWMLLVAFFYDILFNPYKNILRRNVIYELRSSFLFVIVNAFSTFAVLYAFKLGPMYSRLQLVYTYIIFYILSVIARFTWKRYLIHKKKENTINVVIITSSKNAESVIYNVENSEFLEYSIKGVYLIDNVKKCKVRNYPIYTSKDDLYRIITENKVLEVLAYCKPNKIDRSVIERALNDGVQFHISIDKIFGFEPDNEEIDNLAMYRTLKFNAFSFSSAQLLYNPFKRVADITISIIASVFLIPLYLIIKISYLLNNDYDPIIYTHIRVKKDGELFKLYKFRSMVPNSDEILKDLLKDEKRRKEWKEYHKFDDDPRITKIGSFIRKTSLDEFPQFINVLKGDMSIIGPRPLVPGELKSKNGLGIYERVKPGITGWWACNGRSNISYEERLELEYYYVKNYSLGLDFMCVLKTIFVVLFRKGAK